MTLERISRLFIERHPFEAVRTIERLTDEDRVGLLTALEPEAAADVLHAMTPADAVASLIQMTPVQSIPILKILSPNFAAACLRRLPANLRRDILMEAVQHGDLKSVRTLLNFPPDVVGAVMDPETAAVQEQMSAAEAVEFARRHQDKLRNVIYVVNGENLLVGLIEARDLLILKDKTTVLNAMKPIQYKINGRAHLGTASDNAGWEHFDDLPVVDSHGNYLGSLNRKVFLQALTETDIHTDRGEQPKEILIGLAETFLNTCSELLFPDRK